MLPPPNLLALIAIERARSRARAQSKHCLIIRDHRGNWLSANSAALDACGLKHTQWQGTCLARMGWDILHPDGHPLPPGERMSDIAIETGDAQSGIYGLFSRDRAKALWLNIVATPHYDGARRILIVQFDLVNG